MKTIYTSWVTARNAANDFAGVGGKVIGFKDGFVAIHNQFQKVFIVKLPEKE